ncbi:MAG: glycoside hydrolase family 127 protein, partial [Ferruginibacter sp.]|nr:glycoside hydrolase family 127 protein [Ferruginibacter sp.]
DNIIFNTNFKEDTLGGVMELEATAPAIIVSDDGLSVNTKNQKVIAIPYYSWANRGQGQMLMWMARKISAIDIIPKK